MDVSYSTGNYDIVNVSHRFQESILGKVFHPGGAHPQLHARPILIPSLGSEFSSEYHTHLLWAHWCKYLLTGH